MRSAIAPLALLVCSAASAQTSISVNDLSPIPTTGTHADHPIVATNDSGDLCIVWQTSVVVGSVNVKRAEGVFLRREGPSRWRMPTSTSEVMVFGDPVLQILGPIETCQKPRVVSLGQNFAVTWTRVNRRMENGRLETALVEVLPDDVVVALPQPGEGWVVDPDFDGGTSGNTCDLTRKRVPFFGSASTSELRDRAILVNVHEVFQDDDLREYEIRSWFVDYRQHPPFVFGPEVLVPNVAVDSTTAFGEGRLPPFIQEEDSGGVLLAYEEFRSKQRQGQPQDAGYVHVVRFVNQGESVVEADHLVLQGEVQKWHQRRPGLSTSFYDVSNHVGISWTEFSPNGTNPKGHHGAIEVTSAGDLHWTDLGLPEVSGYEVSNVTALHEEPRRGVFVTLDDGEEFELRHWSANRGAWTDIETLGIAPFRPFGIFTGDSGPTPGSSVLALAFDGRHPVTQEYVCFLVIGEI